MCLECIPPQQTKQPIKYASLMSTSNANSILLNGPRSIAGVYQYIYN